VVKIKGFSALWDKAISSEDENYYVVECALQWDKNPGFGISEKGKPPATTNGTTRLLVLKSKKTGAIQPVLMHTFSTSGVADETISYTSRPLKFSGYVFFTSLTGEFINGWLYQNGKIVKQSKGGALPDNDAAKALPPIDDGGQSCTTYETSWYERDCVEYYDGHRECGDWIYLYSTYQTYCSGGGGGTGSGGYDPVPTTPPPQPDPCTEAKALADKATTLSKNTKYTTAKSNIQTAASDGKEHGITFGKDANGNITISAMTTGTGISAPVNISWPGAFADLHNHPTNLPPSPGDLYGIVSLNNVHSGYDTRMVVTPDGSVYALIIINPSLAAQFIIDHPKVQIGDFPPDFPDPVFTDFDDAKIQLQMQGFSNLIAEQMAMAFVLEKYKSGMALLKQDSNGNFKRLRTQENILNGTTTYNATNCQ